MYKPSDRDKRRGEREREERVAEGSVLVNDIEDKRIIIGCVFMLQGVSVCFRYLRHRWCERLLRQGPGVRFR